MSPASSPHKSGNVISRDGAPVQRSPVWVWWISGLLLLATMINYMDRQTLANLKVRITGELSLSNELYGNLEWGFGWSFAAGSLFFGFLSDRISVRFLYPAVLMAWSTMGIITGFCNDYRTMLFCRILLGFFEAGHWPCALRITKTVLGSSKRTMGNSILQSGGALGAILTPPIILMIVGNNEVAGAWRSPFIIIGSLGVVWAVAWLFSIRDEDLPAPKPDTRDDSGQKFDFLRECLVNRKFWTLVPVVICINLTWQLIRAWLPAFLQEGRGATEQAALLFNSAYYIAADVGCISAGVMTLWLSGKGLSAHRSRMLIFGFCAGLTALTTVASVLSLGPALYLVLLIIAAGSLGLFPCYYSMSQESSERHMGKTTGLLGALAWLVSSPLQSAFGKIVDSTRSYDSGLAVAGLAPVVAFVALLCFWPGGSSSDAKLNAQT